MFLFKQFVKALILPPVPWLLLLLAVVIFWRRPWARKLLAITILLILSLHSGPVNYALRYPLESYYPPLIDPTRAGDYDAIVVLMSSSIPAGGLIPFPSIDEFMFRRLDEALRLYRIQAKPIIVSGGHVDPFTPDRNENQIAREFLLRWGVPKNHVIGEESSHDTFENALETRKILKQHGWRRYLLVTSALHMPRSMLAFANLVAEPIAAPGDFSIGGFHLTPFAFVPNEGVAPRVAAAVHEYIGLLNYYWRVKFAEK